MWEATEFRVLALTGLFALGNACMITLVVIWRSGVRSFRLTHLPLLISMIASLTVTALMLAVSTKDHALFPREMLSPYIGLTEWTAFLTGWAWYIFAARASFCIVRSGREVHC